MTCIVLKLRRCWLSFRCVMILYAVPWACKTFLKSIATSNISHISPLSAMSYLHKTCSDVILGFFTCLVELRKLSNKTKGRPADWLTHRQCDWTFFLWEKSDKRFSLFTKDMIKLLGRENSVRRLCILKHWRRNCMWTNECGMEKSAGRAWRRKSRRKTHTV